MLSDPRFDKDRIIRTNDHLLKDSYIWILENDTFLQWQAGEGSRLLWVRGDPGKGKTMLLCGIIEELQRQASGSRIVYLLCQATDANLNSANAVLRGLLYLMIKDEPDLIKDLRESHYSRQLFEDANGWDVLCRMFTDVMSRSASGGTTIIVDALDECIKDRTNLLEFIVKLPSTSTKVLVSSRNWPLIERGLAPTVHKAAHLSLELNEHSVSAAVVTFIKHKVDQLMNTHEYDLETRDLVYNHLVEKASNTFLWAALVCRQLTDIHLDNWNVESKLRIPARSQ
ncbi:vegetative incompatibility protein het-e-1 [Colletotrichum sojae]|uniref:Vegetative incompatibility protein het-e-1 n=1 Tax=Colletotrichum sojae TaxID=2175907 RepID=A0A8H6MYR6_9PEZI|nr:vegetative incompatibility protein het-e-1 [Colletotrichum sojae]